mmetsp:Transcript_36776/g.86390  ORF Transcript_36776/g.86390 Transcript_36776/m.86390 type:complete len:326 (-) Transcript_36776:16-993(-)
MLISVYADALVLRPLRDADEQSFPQLVHSNARVYADHGQIGVHGRVTAQLAELVHDEVVAFRELERREQVALGQHHVVRRAARDQPADHVGVLRFEPALRVDEHKHAEQLLPIAHVAADGVPPPAPHGRVGDGVPVARHVDEDEARLRRPPQLRGEAEEGEVGGPARFRRDGCDAVATERTEERVEQRRLPRVGLAHYRHLGKAATHGKVTVEPAAEVLAVRIAPLAPAGRLLAVPRRVARALEPLQQPPVEGRFVVVEEVMPHLAPAASVGAVAALTRPEVRLLSNRAPRQLPHGRPQAARPAPVQRAEGARRAGCKVRHRNFN